MAYHEDISGLNISVLLTCHNRKETTLRFLNSLINQPIYGSLNIDIYLMDDGSTDGTSEAIALQFPIVKLLKGAGNLFWAGGMRTVWQYAIAQKTYDIFFLFNDDVVLFEDSLYRLLNSYLSLKKRGVILIGSALSPVSDKLSYCGYSLYNVNHAKYYPVEPDKEQMTACNLANANILLVDLETVNKIGILPDSYTHMFADFDYTLTAFKSGLSLLIAPGYYGYCENEHGNNWLSANHKLKERIKYLYSPKGLAIKEYLIYIKKHFPADYMAAFIKLWLKTLFPFIWDKFKYRSL